MKLGGSQMSDEKRIVEINGLKIEVDMRTAKRIHRRFCKFQGFANYCCSDM